MDDPKLHAQMHKLKNRKELRKDILPNKLIKYGGNILANEPRKLFDKTLTKNKI